MGWVGAPGSGDDVTIANGVTVTVDAAESCNDISIQSGGTLDYNGAYTLQVNGDMTNNGTFTTGSGTVIVNGNITNSGTINGDSGTISLSGNWANTGTYNGGTTGIVEFTGTSNTTISGTTTFEELIISKGSLNTTLNITGTVSVSSGGSLTFNGGLINIGSGGNLSLDYSSGLTIPSTAGFDVTGGTLNTGNFSITNQGLIRVSSGTANFGTASGNEVHTEYDGAFIVSGGDVNISGRLYNSAAGTLSPPGVTSGITITGGTVTLATVGNGLNYTGSLQVTAAGNFIFNGGTIVFQNPSNASSELDLGLIKWKRNKGY